MRINVYREELTGETQRFERTAESGVTYMGVRLFLKSPPDLHHNAFDDDRSAITFFVRTPVERDLLATIFRDMARLTDQATTRTTTTGEDDGS